MTRDYRFNGFMGFNGFRGSCSLGSMGSTVTPEFRSAFATIPRMNVADDTVRWLALATSRSVVRRATVVALIVGSILVVINHGDAIVHGDVDAGRLLRIALTMSVPYCVSTYSSVSALRDAARRQPGNHVASRVSSTSLCSARARARG